MENTNTHQQKRHFSEEAALDKVEKKIDHTMEKIMNTGFVAKFLHHKTIKNILNSHFIQDVNARLSPYFTMLFTIVGWISLLTGIIGIFSFLVSLSGLGFMFGLGLGIGIRVLIYVLLALVFSLLSLFVGIGLIRFKKRVISLSILSFSVSALSLLVSLVPIGLYSYRAYGNFGGNLFNLLITFVLLMLIIKNEHMFKN